MSAIPDMSMLEQISDRRHFLEERRVVKSEEKDQKPKTFSLTRDLTKVHTLE